MSGAVLANLMNPTDIILPSWSVPLYQVDGSLCETAITRHTIVLRYPVPEDARTVSLLLSFRMTSTLSCISYN